MAGIQINPARLAELITELKIYKTRLSSNNEEMCDIEKSMDNAWEGDTQYQDVGKKAIEGIISVNKEVIELLGSTLKDLDGWLEAVKIFSAKHNGQMM